MSKELWRSIGEKRLNDCLYYVKETPVGITVNKKFAHGWTCLHAASERGYAEVVAKLIDLGASIEDPDWSGQTPLHLAAAIDDPATVKVLLGAKAKQYSDKMGLLPIHIAAAKSHTDVLEVLLANNKTLVNQQDKSGYTALHNAAEKGCLKSVSLLLKYGANPALTSKDKEQTAYDLAVNMNNTEVVKVLSKYNKKVVTSQTSNIKTTPATKQTVKEKNQSAPTQAVGGGKVQQRVKETSVGIKQPAQSGGAVKISSPQKQPEKDKVKPKALTPVTTPIVTLQPVKEKVKPVKRQAPQTPKNNVVIESERL